MAINRRECFGLLAGATIAPTTVGAAPSHTIALLFESLVSSFWVAAIERFRREIHSRGWLVLEAVSNMDDNRQYEQVRAMIQRKVSGIVIVHTDAKAVIPAIQAANAAGVPVMHFNRPPAPSDAYSVAVVVDNRKLMDETVNALIEIARRRGGHYKAAALLGDLGDANGVHRRDGMQDAVERHADMVEVVARIPTEWNADKAFSGLTNALEAHPDINMVITSSDFLTPQIEQALRSAGKWHPAGDPRHVLIAGFDGDDNGYKQLAAGYYDVDGVQNLDYEVDLTLQTLDRMWEGALPPKILIDPGFVITRETLAEHRDQMWGYRAWKEKMAIAHYQRADTPFSRPTPADFTSASPDGVATTSVSLKWAFSLVAFLAVAHAMVSLGTMHDVLLAVLPLSILVAAQLLVLLIGQIDLSMTAVMAVGSILSASVMTRQAAGLGELGASAAGILTFLVIGASVGLFNGICSAILHIPSFIATLAVMIAGNGIAAWYGSTVSETTSIGGLPEAFQAIGYGTIAGVPIALLLSATVLAATHYVLSRTVPGQWLYAVGRNVEAARISGVPVKLVTIAAFTASGIGAALASVIYTSRIETGLSTLGQNMLLDIVGAAVIGGVSLFGGRGNIWMALAGATFLCVLDKSLQVLGISLFVVLAVKGCAIVLAAIRDIARSRGFHRA